MGQPQPFVLFAPCAPGLEPLLLAEVRAAGGVRPKVVPGGVELEANEHVLGQCLLELGLALDLRVRLGEFPARGLDAITRGTASLDWGRFLGPGQTVEVRATTRHSRHRHTGAIEERVASGIRAAVGNPAAVDDEDPWRVFARAEGDRVAVSLSVAGAPLHRRGYRLALGRAPLREDLARGLLRLARWEPTTALFDPFMGSGTLLVEAARLARGIPPGWERPFHWHRAPIFDPERWSKIVDRAGADIRDAAPAPIVGSDRDAGAVLAALENARRAGVEADLTLDEAPLSRAPGLERPPSPPGLWLSNPPFGDRAGGGPRLLHLYQTIGLAFRKLPEGWRLGLLVRDPKLAHGTGVPLRSAALLDHGGKKVRLYLSS